MSKHVHTKVTRLPKLEQAFKEALHEIAHAHRWTISQLISDIQKQPGDTLTDKCRLYALNYYRDNTPPRGFAEEAPSPFEAALMHVRQHRPTGAERLTIKKRATQKKTSSRKRPT